MNYICNFLFARLILRILFLLLFCQSLQAQWVSNSGGLNYYSVTGVSPDTAIWAQSLALHKTVGPTYVGGFALADVNGFALTGTLFYKMHFFNGNDGIAVGQAYLGNNECVFKTNNGGANWSIVWNSQLTDYPRDLNDMHFPTGTVGFVVGKNGLVLKTADGGNSWLMCPTPATPDFFGVHFVDAMTGYVVGDTILLKTINGGLSWNVQTFNNLLTDVHFPTANVGYISSGNGVYKTVDAGINWNLMDQAAFITDIQFVNTDTGYALAAYDILRTTNGGMYWDQYNSNKFLRDLYFIDANVGFACGEGGKRLHTYNGGGPFRPVAEFSMNTPICHNQNSLFTNKSNPAYEMSWRLNGQAISSDYHLNHTFSQPNQPDTVQLIVSNGGLSDTASAVITVSNDIQPQLQSSIQQAWVCPGQSTNVIVNSSESATSYKLFVNGMQVGSQQSGYGGNLTLSTGPISQSNNSVSIVATRTVYGCGTGTDTMTYGVYLGVPDLDTEISTSTDTVCFGTYATVVLSASDTSAVYALKVGSQSVGLPQTGNGDSLFFPTSGIDTSSWFTVHTTSNTYGCTAPLTQNVQVVVEHVVVYAAASAYSAVVGDSVDWTNNSNCVNCSYQWNFGNGAFPPAGNTGSMTVEYNVVGVHEASLIVTSQNSCADTALRMVNVIGPIAVDSCKAIQILSYTPEIVTYDPYGNLYTVCKIDSDDPWLVTSGVPGDTAYFNHFATQNDYSVLIKYDKRGLIQWLVPIHRTGTNDLVVDSMGNVYCILGTPSASGGDVEIYSADQSKYILPTFNPNGSWAYKEYLCSFDRFGVLRWTKVVGKTHYMQDSKIVMFKNEFLYISKHTDIQNNWGYNNNKLCRFDMNGSPLWTDNVVETHFVEWDMVTDTAGNVIYVLDNEDKFRWVDTNGAVIHTANLYDTQYGGRVSYKRIVRDANGCLFVIGDLQDTIVFNGNLIAGPVGGVSGLTCFVSLKYSPAGVPLSYKRLEVKYGRIMGHALENGQVTTYIFTDGSFAVVGSDTVNFANATCNTFLYRVDTAGTTATIQNLIGEPPGPCNIAPNFYKNLFCVSPSTDEVSVYFATTGPVSLGGDTIVPLLHHPANGLLFSGNAACLYDVTVVPPVVHSQSLPLCPGQSVTVGTHVYNTTGTYTDHFYNTAGIDSIVYTNVVVFTPDKSVSLINSTLTANAGNGVTYQWIDCATNQPVINGTTQSFTPTVNGSFKVLITDTNGCTVASACTNVTNVGVGTVPAGVITLSPNPSAGSVLLHNSGSSGTLVFFNTLSQPVRTIRIQTPHVTIDDLPEGVLTYKYLSDQGWALIGRLIVIR